MFAAGVKAQTPSGIAGTWKLDVAKSTFSPGPAPKSMTVTYTPIKDGVRIKVDLDVTIEPEPQNVRELLAKAERDCFVGASLTARPRYRWTVNGEDIA